MSMDSTAKGSILPPTFTPPALLISSTASSTALLDSLPSKKFKEVVTPMTILSAAMAPVGCQKQGRQQQGDGC